MPKGDAAAWFAPYNTATDQLNQFANGSLRNQPGFYDAFGVKKGDKMYLSPKERVIIW